MFLECIVFSGRIRNGSTPLGTPGAHSKPYHIARTTGKIALQLHSMGEIYCTRRKRAAWLCERAAQWVVAHVSPLLRGG